MFFRLFWKKKKPITITTTIKLTFFAAVFFCVCVSDRHKKWLETITKHDSQHFESGALFFYSGNENSQITFAMVLCNFLKLDEIF